MKNLTHTTASWLKLVSACALSLGALQLFVACGGGGSGAPPQVTVPPAISCVNGIGCGGIGSLSANAANLVATVIGRIVTISGATYELQMQIVAPTAINSSGLGGAGSLYGGSSMGYSGSVQLVGSLSILNSTPGGYTCNPAAGSYTIQGSGTYSGSGSAGSIAGTLTAQGATSVQMSFQDTFIQAAAPPVVSQVNGQSFPFRILGDVFVTGTGIGVGYGGYGGTAATTCAIQQQLFFGMN